MYVIQNLFWYVINPKENTPAAMPYTLRVITYAYRRLHANPSDWIKKEKLFSSFSFLAAELGFEPRQTESESAVLPLHNSAIFLTTDNIITDFF